ncbi:hypothetical protein CEXT_189951 [Caerostris extrusa]|uniref:Uncharacterized protein n=1 Tax=Caerostris extrusa TaxID=172846 RepID=A0AAV4RDZ7_CAEEX|nr:hypothetical protein CEXT_189951 [Caerostris extrusa]
MKMEPQILRPTILKRTMDSEGACFLKNLVVLVLRNCPSTVLRKFYFGLRGRHSNFLDGINFRKQLLLLEIDLAIYQVDFKEIFNSKCGEKKRFFQMIK